MRQVGCVKSEWCPQRLPKVCTYVPQNLFYMSGLRAMDTGRSSKVSCNLNKVGYKARPVEDISCRLFHQKGSDMRSVVKETTTLAVERDPPTAYFSTSNNISNGRSYC